MKKLKNRNIFILLTIILSLGITLGAVYFMYQYKDSRENELSTGMISLNFTEKSEVINLSSNVPMIDDLGLKSRPYEFTITNTSKVPIKTKIMLDVDKTTTIKYGAVRYALFIDDEKVIKDYIHKDNLTLYEVEELVPNQVLNCKLYFWVDYYYDYPGEIFKAKIKAVGESRDELQSEAITVTFDSVGGTLDTTTKEVYYHGQYGELPIPVKEGYTFMGWNGKNKFNIERVINDCYIYYGNGKETPYYSSSLPWNCSDYIEIKANNIYTFNPNSTAGSYDTAHSIYDENKNFIKSLSSGKLILEIPNNGKFVRFSYRRSDSTNIQLEEGDTATEYEPYYIKSDTKVVQNKNHTLKAIWEENS